MEKKSAFLIVHLITQVIRKAFSNLLLTGETALEEQEGDQDSKMVNKYTSKVLIFSNFLEENCAGKSRYLTTRNISGGGGGRCIFIPIPPPLGRRVVGIRFQRDRQKRRGVGKVFSKGSDKKVRW